MMRRALTVAVLFLAACPKEVPPSEETKVAEPVDAGAPVAAAEPEQPPAPKVQLPPAPELPLAPAHLSDVEDSKDNPTTAEKVALGHQLFFDARISKDGSMACVACHDPARNWTSPNAVDPKVGGAANKRNSPTVVNLAYHSSWYWDGRMPTLEAVCNAAWKGQLGADPAAVAAKLNGNPTYNALFHRAFKEDATTDNIPKALASFLRTLKAGNAAYDKAEAGDKKATSADAQKGWALFKKSGCINCHVPPLFTDFDFHDVGIGADKPEAERDPGRKDATKADADFGKFKTPTLRSVALSAPYFHDGRAKTLDEAIEWMTEGFAKQKGVKVDEKLKAQKLSKKDKAQLKAFLESLNSETTFGSAKPELPPE
ncbi:MAG: cytochrome-c peroxidase [Archangiaceae bacterium]|nr:cytochrome-c peroxidase [Archangiaceae bacterium]